MTLDSLWYIVKPLNLHIDSDLQFACYMLLSFFGMFRYSDLMRTRWCDVEFGGTHIKLTPVGTKTDVFKQGQSVVIKALPQLGTLCPVSLLTNYKRRSFRNGTDGLLFANPSKSKPHATLSRDCLTKRLRKGLADAEADAARYSLHSLRAGGATAAAAAGTGIEQIAKHGRWRSSAVSAYIRPSLQDQMTVSEAIAADAGVRKMRV